MNSDLIRNYSTMSRRPQSSSSYNEVRTEEDKEKANRRALDSKFFKLKKTTTTNSNFEFSILVLFEMSTLLNTGMLRF